MRINFYNTLFYLSLLAVLFTRMVVYLTYNINLIDTDQPYMWLGAMDYAKGLFYEPRYYGQDYNTFMEALLAVPFLWLRIPVYYALPFITQLLSLFPFLFTSFYLFYHQKKAQAILVVGILLCLPPHYDLLNGLPRGFVTGLFFNSFFILSCLQPQRIFFVGLNTCMALLGYFVNPNSLLVSVPLLFYLFLHHYKNSSYYYSLIPALLMTPLLYWLFNGFYIRHPEYVCQTVQHQFSLNYFMKAISHLDNHFEHITFFEARASFTLLIVLGVTGYLLLKQNQKAFAAFCMFITLLLISFASGKVADGSFWVFMSLSRMFLGIPLLLALFFSFIEIEPKKYLRFLLLIPLLFWTYKITRLTPELEREDIRDLAQGVRVLSLEQCKDITSHYKKACADRKMDFFLVSSTFWLNTIVSTAGVAMDKDYPETQETRFEKRYWVRNKNRNRFIKEFVFLSSEYDLDKLAGIRSDFELQRIDDYGLYLVKNNKLPMGRFIETMNEIEPELNE